jgi:hypothetical protein
VLGPEFDVLASWPVLIVAGVLLVVEIVADKIPAVDHVWDAVHTFVRTPGAMVVVAILMQGQDVTWQVIAILVAGGVAFVAHAGKATARAASTKTTAATANAIVSAAEDVFVAVGSVLAAFYPVVLGALVLAALLAGAIFGPKLVRAFRINWAVSSNYFRYLWRKLRRWLEPGWRPKPKARLALYVKRVVKAKVRGYYYKELEDVYVGEDTLLDRLFFAARGRPYVLSFFKGREPTAADVAGLIAAGRAKP